MYTSLCSTHCHMYPPTGIPSWSSLSQALASYSWLVCSELVESRGPEFFMHCSAERKCVAWIPCISLYWLSWGPQHDHRHWHCELYLSLLACTPYSRHYIQLYLCARLYTTFSLLQTGGQYFDEEQQHLGVPPLHLKQLNYSQYCYDATWTLAYALNQTIVGNMWVCMYYMWLWAHKFINLQV